MNHQQLIEILIVVDEEKEEEDGGGGVEVGVGEEDHPTRTINLVSCNFKLTNSFTNFSQNDK